ncbi:hypothetical protein Srubr_35960 [Streptomyces rubradiris]|uniref:Uncharacterized protein n=1 Tax=Streptomyces rubradiris TaxID=285531 RepID=A0ABQ3RD18_STRRR|nr:hypothetical protein GCM10018792_04880 [Streptomyces rubradiris]GHI53750.1 hypothetical protein Srubr_35960 [Streptomyces rubradiris]
MKTEADSRYAVITQVAVDGEACRACCTVGRAGAISDWSMEKTPAPVARTAKVRRVEARGMEKPLRNQGRDQGSGSGKRIREADQGSGSRKRSGKPEGRVPGVRGAGARSYGARPGRGGGGAGRVRPRLSHPALVKWRYASTLAEATLRFNSNPLPGRQQ